MSKQKSKTKKIITITEKAANKLLELAKQDKKEGYGLKIYVFPGGCAGFQYGMDFEKKPDKTDLIDIDKWVLTKYSKLVEKCSKQMDNYDYNQTMKDIEYFLWHELADHYLEMIKGSLYENKNTDSIRYTLYTMGLGTIKLFAPFFPHLTEEIYQEYYQKHEKDKSIHISNWPGSIIVDESKEKAGETKEAESLAEDKTIDQSESGEKEVAAEEGGEKEGSAEEETAVETEEVKTEIEATKNEDEKRGEEEKVEGNIVQEGEEAIAEEESEEAGLVSSEELIEGAEDEITDEEWVKWKREFLDKFHRGFNKKWITPGIGMVILIVGLVGFFVVPNFLFTDTGEVKSLEEIAGPVCDMKFFLPLTVSTEKTRFVKIAVAVELMDKDLKKEIEKKIYELRKEVINLLLTKSPEEVQSSHGKEVLRKEITIGLNKFLLKDCIKNTYFTELVVL